MTRRTAVTRGPDQTRNLAGALLKSLPGRRVWALYGELGSGKTCFAQGIALALGVKARVNSPSFTIVNEYRGTAPMFHADLYRIAGAAEASGLGLEEYFETGGITVVEWAEKAAGLIPADAVRVRFRPGAAKDERTLTIEWE